MPDDNEKAVLDPQPPDIDLPQEVYDKYSDEDLSLALAGDDKSLESEEESTDKSEKETTETESSGEDKTPETPADEPGEETLDGEQSSNQDEDVGEEDEDEDEYESSSEDQTELSDLELKEDEEIVVELEEGGEVVPLDQIIDEFKNDREWQKSNTEKSQEIAERRREMDETVATLGTEEIQKALADDEFMEAVDEWFEGKDKNPFRKSEGVKEYSDRELKLIQDDVSLQIDREIFDLQKSDKSLDDEKKVSELVQFAAQEGLRVPIAYKVMNHDSLAEQVDSLTSELKKTNRELSQLKKKPVIKPKKSVKGGKGAITEDYSKPASDFDEARERASKELDRLMAIQE